jgi:hypothetical protein
MVESDWLAALSAAKHIVETMEVPDNISAAICCQL